MNLACVDFSLSQHCNLTSIISHFTIERFFYVTRQANDDNDSDDDVEVSDVEDDEDSD